MTWNIAPEIISLVFLGIVWVYSRTGSHLPSLKNRTFQMCLLITFVAMLSNILSTIMIYFLDAFPLWLVWTVTMIYFIFTPLMGLVYFCYVIAIIYDGSKLLKWIIGIGLIPGAVYILLVLTNPFTCILFCLSEECGYARGVCVFITYVIFYIYSFASLAVTIMNRHRMERKVYNILAIFPLLAVLVIVIQQIEPEVILSGSAATCAMLIIYLHFQNRQITRDYLTNVPNRQELLDMLGLLIEKHPEKQFTLAVLSLREFRQVNNICGQHRGDEFLRAVCGFLCQVGPRDGVYRFSGDEFALLFTRETDDEIKKCITAIRERMKQPWEITDYRFVLSTAMGMIRRVRKDYTLETAVHSIEYAVYQAKNDKNNSICYCDEAMLAKLDRKRNVIQILKDRLSKQSFEMYYQPIYFVKDGNFRCAESLMRLNNTPIGPIYPSEFIPVAEETGLIIEITYVILDKVCKYINDLEEAGIHMDAIHVNYSAIQFSEPDLAEKTLEIIRRNKTPMSTVKIEFTESTLAENTEVVTEFCVRMKEHGITVGLDDFGTGYSNIATVLNVPFSLVKLDKSLVWAAMEKDSAYHAVQYIISAFKALGMSVVAEGVETEEQKKLVVDFQVAQIQGFYYSKPMPGEDMKKFMLEHGKNGKGRQEEEKLPQAE